MAALQQALVLPGTRSPTPAAVAVAGIASAKAQRIASHLSASSTLFLAPSSLERSRPKRWHACWRRNGVVAEQAVEELPTKLQEIVKLFQSVSDPRAKYEQLLHYAKRLKPLAPEHFTKENKVEGCVSQVWVRPILGPDKRLYFEAESDSALTKGLAALLVEGLSGSTPAEILRVSPDFIQMLGLKQSLTPSRSNGFFNMLKLIQKKTLQLYMEAEGVGASQSAPAAAGPGVRELSSGPGDREQALAGVAHASLAAESVRPAQATAVMESKSASISKKVREALSPTVFELEDVSHQHAGHAGVHKGATETHFNLKVVSKEFEGRSLVKRHRLIYDLLHEELKTGVHALSLVTKTPAEYEK